MTGCVIHLLFYFFLFACISDQSPPELRCNSSITVVMNSESQYITYDALAFIVSQAENSGIIDLSYSVNPLSIDRYGIGEVYTIRITGTDPSKNSDTCLVQVKVTGNVLF